MANKAVGQPTISLCTIVKNEEEFIGQCLESLKDAVDEMVIVDTGSTDRTVEIAESYGAKVYHHPWQDSFSQARNHALKHATGEWILHLDADEELERADIPLLKQMLKSDLYDSVFVPIFNYLPDGNISRFYYRRLFRRTKGHYEGIVHNQIIVDGKWSYAEIRIHHHGYNLSTEQMAAKYTRSENLLKKQINQEPNNVFARFNLARTYRNQEKYNRAIEEGKRALDLNPYESQPFTYFMTLFDVAYCLFMKHKYEEAEQLCLEGIEKDSKNLDLTFTLASVYVKQERYEEAIEHFRRFLRILDQSKKYPTYNLTTLIVDSWSFEDKALNNIGQCYLFQGNIDKAVKYYERLIAEHPGYLTFYKSLALCYLKSEKLAKAAGVLQRPVAAGIADGFVYFKLGEISRETGEFGKALDFYKQALTLGYKEANFYNSYGYVLFFFGQFHESLEKLLRAIELSPHHVGALLNLMRVYQKLEEVDKAMEIVDRIKGLESGDPVIFMEAGDTCVFFRKYKKAIELYEKFLVQRPDDARTLINLASCYARLGHLESAKVGYRAALAIDPSYLAAEKNLAILEKACFRNMESA